MQVIDRGIVFDASTATPDEKCSAFTSLMRMDNGTLLCSFNTGPQKISPQDNLILMRSADGGKTWHRLFDGFNTTFNGTPGSFTAGYLFEREPGKLLISLHWVDRTDPTRPLSNPQTSGVLPMKYLISESNDAGATWSPPREVSLSPHPGTNPTTEILRLQNNDLLLAYESWKEWGDVTGNQSANVKLSSDDGATWGPYITMASDPQGRDYYWDNHLTLDENTGRVLGAFWTHDSSQGKDVPIHLVWGSPDGKEWTSPQNTGIEGQVTSPVVLPSGQILLAYVHRHNPPSIRAILSDDDGQTWQQDSELILHEVQGGPQAGMDQARNEAEYWDDMCRWTFGHPKAIRLPNNQVYVIYYAPPEDYDPTKAQPDNPVPTSIHWALLG